MKFRLIHFLLMMSIAFILIDCSSTDPVTNSPRQVIPPPDYSFVHFDPSAGDPAQIPVPNEILRNPLTGQLALPLTGDPAVDALIGQVNTLSGFSTSAPFRIPFVGKVNEESVNGQTILLVDLVDLAAAQQGAAVNPLNEVRFEVRSDASGENSVIFGFPVRPLSPGHTHLVVVTQGVIGTESGLPVESESLTILLKGETPFVDGNGNSTRASLDNATAAALEPLRQIYQTIWAAAEGVTGQDRLFIPFAFAYTTQPLFDTLTELRARAQNETPTPVIAAASIGAAAVDGLLNALGLGAVPHASVDSLFFGSYNAPNYISHPLNGPFQGSGSNVVEVGRNNINFIAALPAGPGPFPTIIFQHGITGFKEQGVAMLEGATSAGFAVIGIDLVLHGDRTADFLDNSTGAPGPDGIPDPSGSNFINLANLLVSRDNVRQSVSDLFVLTRMITSGAADFNGDGSPELAPVGITFQGMSLGGIVGGSFAAMEPNVQLANLNVPGGRVAYLLNGSQAFGPVIDAGLATFGLVPGSPLYDLYFLFTQTIIDDADPFNYAPHMLSGSLSGAGTAVLMQEMIGDAVVPNFATRDFATAMNLDQVNAVEAIDGLNQVSAPHVGSGLFQYGEGGHGALLDPGSGPTVAIQTQSVTYLGSGLLGSPTIIDPLSAKSNKVNLKDFDFIMEMDVDPNKVILLPQR